MINLLSDACWWIGAVFMLLSSVLAALWVGILIAERIYRQLKIYDALLDFIWDRYNRRYK